MRTDAARNRDLIIDAYIDLTSPHRANPALTDVATAAGVSRITLYRHFGDGEALRRAASIRLLDGLIRAGQESGELREDLPAEWMADAMLWLLYGATIIPTGFDRYNVSRSVLSTFLDGARGPGSGRVR